jgi:hypothetical protein
MESILWALDLVGVLLLCRWAIREEARTTKPGRKD